MDGIEKVMHDGAKEALVKKISSLLWLIKLASERGGYLDAGVIKLKTLRGCLKEIHSLASEAEAFTEAYAKAAIRTESQGATNE